MFDNGEKSYENSTPFKIKYLQGEKGNEDDTEQKEIQESESPFDKEFAKVSSEYLAGNTDENKLTNKIFFDRHDELKRDEPLKPHQKELIKEWLKIRNELIRPSLSYLKSKGKEDTTTYPNQSSDKKIGFEPEPMKVPPENPVEFAPEPIGTAHWPVLTQDKDWSVVSYQFGPSKNDYIRGRNTAREFYARRGSDRFHGAIDLYGRAGDKVVAIQDGIFLYAIEGFLGNTSAMYIQHTIEQPNVIVVYGEIKKKSWETYGLKRGDKVKAGKVIAELGITPGGTSMLHFETWDMGLTDPSIKNRLHSSYRSWKKGGNPPKHLLNPTKYLLAIRRQELERRKQNRSSVQSDKFMFNESVGDNESESPFGSVLSDIGSYAKYGIEFTKISSEYLAGNTDENKLTNKIFFDRHTELKRDEPLKPHQKELINEWLSIRNNIVRPIIAKLTQKNSSISTPIPDKVTKSDSQNPNDDIKSLMSDIIEIERDLDLLSTKLDLDNKHVIDAISRFMEVMALDKLAFESTTVSVINAFLKGVKDSVVDEIIDVVADKIPILKVASVAINAYRNAKEEYEKSITAHENLFLADFINQYRTSSNKYYEIIKIEVIPRIVPALKNALVNAPNNESRKLLKFLINTISKIIGHFVYKPQSWYILQLCKNYIKINKGSLVMALFVSTYNKETRSILVNPDIIKIKSSRAPNLEKLLYEVMKNGEISSITGVMDLPIKKIIYLYEKGEPPTWTFSLFSKSNLVDSDPQNVFLNPYVVLLNEDNSLAQPIKSEKTSNMWEILMGSTADPWSGINSKPGFLNFKNFTS